MFLNVGFYYTLATLFNCFLFYTFWNWSMILILIFFAAFQCGIPALLRLREGLPNFQELGQWAVITGPTDGIGKAYATLLAQTGMNLVLISRNSQKLDKTKREIEKQLLPGVRIEIKTITVDFVQPVDVDNIRFQLEPLNIGVLINNVGMSYPGNQQGFLEAELKYYNDMVNCNINSMTTMTSIVLPQMVERKKGMIINVGSVAAHHTAPRIAVYSGTKGFVRCFTKSLASEYLGSGVRVLLVEPGYVKTKMIANTLDESVATPGPMDFAVSHLKTSDLIPVSHGWWLHDLQCFAGSIIAPLAPLIEMIMSFLIVSGVRKTYEANLTKEETNKTK